MTIPVDTDVKHKRGQAMIIAALFFIIGSLIIMGGVAAPVVRGLEAARVAEESRQSFFASESGVEDVAYRTLNVMDVSATEVLTLGGAEATTSVQTVADETEVVAVGDRNEHIRRTQVVLVQGTGVSFNVGVQVGEGGLFMQNDSEIVGNVYSNGPVRGNGDTELIRGEAISAGPSGLFDTLHATSSVFAHTIENAHIEGDAFCQELVGSNTIEGDSAQCPDPDTEDQPLADFPISDAQIAEWQQAAEDGGTLVCSDGSSHKITSSTTLGPVKIPCDLQIQENGTVTLEGHVWVDGDITVQDQMVIAVSPSLDDKSIAFIADDSSDSESHGKITLQNQASFVGSGDPGSYVLMISQNTSAESGGGTQAMTIQNGVEGDLLAYAPHGEIRIQDDIHLKQVTAYKIHTQNTAQVVYETGVASLLFTSGPSGGFTFTKWSEVE